MGASAYDIIEIFKDKIDPGSIVEIGSSRGEGSTNFFIDFIKGTDQKFYTVDIRSEVIEHYNNKKIKNFLAICEETSQFIELVNGPVSFVYMDGFDYIPPDDSIEHEWMQQMIADYKARNPDDPSKWLTNENSAKHHLERTEVLLPLMSDRAIFLFDDTFMPSQLRHVGWFKNAYDPNSEAYTSWQGKGATAVPFLIKNGWKVLPRIERPGRDDYVALVNF